MPNLKFALAPTPNPDASQWNIGCIGSQRKMLALAMYISCFLCRFHLRLVPNANPISGGIWALQIRGKNIPSTKFEVITSVTLHHVHNKIYKMYGLDQNVQKFMNNYMSCRKQHTTVNGFCSPQEKITYGTAQGSILGPLIFIFVCERHFQLIGS